MGFIKNALKRKYRKYAFVKKNKGFLALDWITAEKVNNVPPQKIKKICFITPGILAFSGGFTSILRLGTYLSDFGHEVTYVSYDNQPLKDLKSSAKKCLENYKGDIMLYNGLTGKENFDVIIATNFMSVYYAAKIPGYKMIFVQDYEPFFYEAGEFNLIAKKSYELGFHMVSLGSWNKSMILKHVDDKLNIDTVTFPYEQSEYHYVERDFGKYAQKNTLKLCVYMRDTPRRLPGLCQIIVKNLKEKFIKDGQELQVFYFGEDIGKYEYGINLGKLNKKQLQDLYAECDFGMVASYTNISLVPYEMLATGLPLIEFYDGSFRSFFDEDCAFLFNLDYDALYAQIKESIQNPQILAERSEKIQKQLSLLSWENTAKEFERILQNMITQ